MKSNTNKGAGIPVAFSLTTGCELPAGESCETKTKSLRKRPQLSELTGRAFEGDDAQGKQGPEHGQFTDAQK